MAVTELEYRLMFCCKIPPCNQRLAQDKEVSTVVIFSPHPDIMNQSPVVDETRLVTWFSNVHFYIKISFKCLHFFSV